MSVVGFLTLTVAASALAQLPADPPMSPLSPAPPALEQPIAPVDPAVPPEQKFGEEPPDYSHQFLRQDSVLLRAGCWQMDVGLHYMVYHHDYTTLLDVGGTLVPVDTRLMQRLLTVPVDFRYGITDRLQAFVNVPFGWSNMQDGYIGQDEFTNQGGIGDVNTGISWLVHKSEGQSYDPDIIATFGLTAPTADVNPLQGILLPPNTLLGQGFWFGYWNVIFVHTVDPVVLFYGFGSRHGVTTESDGYDIAPGDQYFYRAGVGFAVNERITLSGALMGSYVTEPKLNNVMIPGLAMEPISLRFATTIARPCQKICEPFVEFGLTPDAPNARIGVTFTY